MTADFCPLPRLLASVTRLQANTSALAVGARGKPQTRKPTHNQHLADTRPFQSEVLGPSLEVPCPRRDRCSICPSHAAGNSTSAQPRPPPGPPRPTERPGAVTLPRFLQNRGCRDHGGTCLGPQSHAGPDSLSWNLRGTRPSYAADLGPPSSRRWSRRLLQARLGAASTQHCRCAPQSGAPGPRSRAWGLSLHTLWPPTKAAHSLVS